MARHEYSVQADQWKDVIRLFLSGVQITEAERRMEAAREQRAAALKTLGLPADMQGLRLDLDNDLLIYETPGE